MIIDGKHIDGLKADLVRAIVDGPDDLNKMSIGRVELHVGSGEIHLKWEALGGKTKRLERHERHEPA